MADDYEPLRSTWVHQAWLASGCSTILLAFVKSITNSIRSQIWVEPTLGVLVWYVLADLISGIYHWGVDNYGDAKTPIFGSQIEGFLWHHNKPWTLPKNDVAANLHAIALVVTIVALPIILISDDPTLLAFMGSLWGFGMFSQQFHAWSHSTKNSLSPIVVTLQNLGVILSHSQHAAHHHNPFNSNYCIVSGIWNRFLDQCKVFEAIEMVIFLLFRVRPRSWGEPNLGLVDESSTSSSLPND